ncbi:uncharacterized protein LOC121796701 [Salvia splendens]|uniref:uncharacterized protein LOC121796701 n=1 Tax=Salvia splendens TaxID=180675 RepID=UPI001C269190|nr:uncharacterized protein LOC121796701 [Salvia splendens]
MSAWVYASVDSVRGKNQKGEALWLHVQNLYHVFPDNENVAYEQDGSNSKRTKTSESDEYTIPSNPETPTSGHSTSSRPIGRDKAKVRHDWEWKNYPNAWARQYTGRSGKPTIIFEAVTSYDLWIWHAFFGTPGSCNDINVLHRSPVFDDVLEGRAPNVNYVVNGHQYNRAYYLTDGIYPPWAAFIKSITSPQTQKRKLFAQFQESIRKDVERAFGVLQARFAYLRRPCLVWDKMLMGKIMIACIIMYNIIVEDERDTYQNYYDPTEFFEDTPIRAQEGNAEAFYYSTQRIRSLFSYLTNQDQLRNREAHIALRDDLIEHIWEKFGTDN